MKRDAARPRVGRRIARGLLVLVDLAEDAGVIEAPRLFALSERDRASLAAARAYARALARWHGSGSARNAVSSPPPSTPDERLTNE